MKVLWLCNCPLSEVDARGTGTWLTAMAQSLAVSNSVELGAITLGPVKCVTREDCGAIRQWIVPAGMRLRGSGLPSVEMVNALRDIVDGFSPDLLHIWGTECFWGLLSARGVLRYPALLEIQGLKGVCAREYFGGLAEAEKLCCIGWKELLKLRTLYADQRAFRRWGTREVEIIRGHKFVGYHSAWIASYLRSVGRGCHIFQNERVLRKPFYTAEAWTRPQVPSIFCSAGYAAPFKGLHVAIRSLKLLRQRYPTIRLRIGGAHRLGGLRQDGYLRWVTRLIQHLGLEDAIDWLGALSAEQIVAELQSVSVAVVPSYVESYCVTLVEAMMVGTPCVSSFTGGTAHLGRDEDTCLFFPPGDVSMSAFQIDRVISDGALSEGMSQRARSVALVRNDPCTITQRQVETYRTVLQTN